MYHSIYFLIIIPHFRTESSDSVKTVTVTESTLTSPEKVTISESSELETSRTVKTVKTEKTQVRIAQQLEEVRRGIFKLLSESDDEERKEVSKTTLKHIVDEDGQEFRELGVSALQEEEETPGYQADEETEEDSVSQSVEIPTVNNPPETPDMGCVSAEKEERPGEADRGTDSGIERGQGSSRAASAEERGWLARLTSRVRHGSTGQLSQSSTPEYRRPEVRTRPGSVPVTPDSPRDGGFAEAGLEMRVRELWLRLAQMETEKLRAVEIAVEEERKRGSEILAKERLKVDRDKRELESQRERLDGDRAILEQQRLVFQQTQAREAELVNKLQVGHSIANMRHVCRINDNRLSIYLCIHDTN